MLRQHKRCLPNIPVYSVVRLLHPGHKTFHSVEIYLNSTLNYILPLLNLTQFQYSLILFEQRTINTTLSDPDKSL